MEFTPALEDRLLLLGLKHPDKLKENADKAVELVENALSHYHNDPDYKKVMDRIKTARDTGDFEKEFPHALMGAVDLIRYP